MALATDPYRPQINQAGAKRVRYLFQVQEITLNLALIIVAWQNPVFKQLCCQRLIILYSLWDNSFPSHQICHPNSPCFLAPANLEDLRPLNRVVRLSKLLGSVHVLAEIRH